MEIPVILGFFRFQNLYDHFMDMLDDRGINDDFIKELVEFSTAFDHTHYVKFLEGLKSFVDKN